MIERQGPKKKTTPGVRETVLAGVVVAGVAGGVALSERAGKPTTEATPDTSSFETGDTGEAKAADKTTLQEISKDVGFRDSVALTFLRNLPEGYRVNPTSDSISIVTAEGKDMGDVFVDPETHELTFEAPKWAVSDLDALGDFTIEQFTFTNPAEIAGLAEDMVKITEWSEEYGEFKQAASQDLFANVGSTNFEKDVASSNRAIEEEQKELVQKVQNESNGLHLKIN